MYFRFFVIIPLWERAEPINWTNVNSFHPRMFCAMYGWKWPKRWWKCEKFTDTDDGKTGNQKAHLSRMNLRTHSIIRFDKSSTRTTPYPTRLFSSDRHLNSNALWNIANLVSEFFKYYLDFYLLGLAEQKTFFKIHVQNIIIENSFQKM